MKIWICYKTYKNYLNYLTKRVKITVLILLSTFDQLVSMSRNNTCICIFSIIALSMLSIRFQKPHTLLCNKDLNEAIDKCATGIINLEASKKRVCHCSICDYVIP